MAAVEIKCSVANCHYWKEMYCVAREIEVNCDDGSSEADTTDATCCDTFLPRDS